LERRRACSSSIVQPGFVADGGEQVGMTWPDRLLRRARYSMRLMNSQNSSSGPAGALHAVRKPSSKAAANSEMWRSPA
jgi:hypothetical protein